MKAGDRTTAEALRLARDQLERLGWKYSDRDIGKMARVILDALEEEDTTK